MMVKKNICCFGDIIGKTDLCNEMTFSKVAILAIFRFAGYTSLVSPNSQAVQVPNVIFAIQLEEFRN